MLGLAYMYMLYSRLRAANHSVFPGIILFFNPNYVFFSQNTIFFFFFYIPHVKQLP